MGQCRDKKADRSAPHSLAGLARGELGRSGFWGLCPDLRQLGLFLGEELEQFLLLGLVGLQGQLLLEMLNVQPCYQLVYREALSFDLSLYARPSPEQ